MKDIRVLHYMLYKAIEKRPLYLYIPLVQTTLLESQGSIECRDLSGRTPLMYVIDLVSQIEYDKDCLLAVINELLNSNASIEEERDLGTLNARGYAQQLVDGDIKQEILKLLDGESTKRKEWLRKIALHTPTLPAVIHDIIMRFRYPKV
jgi:hypothetical protein